MDGIANSSHAKLEPRPPWKPGCEPKADKNKMINERLKKIAKERRYSFAELKTIMDSILEQKTEEAFDKLKTIMFVADQHNKDLEEARKRVCDANDEGYVNDPGALEYYF